MTPRRTFLGMVAAACGLGAVATTATATPSPHPDRFTYRGWHVSWYGWQQPVNQAVMVGFWVAWVNRGTFRAATTCGGYHDYVYHELGVIDMMNCDGWPRASRVPLMSDAERDALKQRACRALLEHL